MLPPGDHGIERLDPGAVDQQRVDLERFEGIAEGQGKVPDPGDHRGQGVAVGGRRAADAVQDRPAAQPVQQAAGLPGRDR